MLIRIDSSGEKSEADIFENHFVDDSSDNFIPPIKGLTGKKVLGKVLGWAKVIILGGLMMGYFALKEFLEKKKRKEV